MDDRVRVMRRWAIRGCGRYCRGGHEMMLLLRDGICTYIYANSTFCLQKARIPAEVQSVCGRMCRKVDGVLTAGSMHLVKNVVSSGGGMEWMDDRVRVMRRWATRGCGR